jgi:flavin reductase (DIM6/NTAB) family NADH-FMN oxidoreductase RutF
MQRNSRSKSISTLTDCLDPEIWILTSGTMENPAGLVCTSVFNASISPQHPRMLIGLSKFHHTCQRLLTTGQATLHLLHKENSPLVERFGLTHGLEKFSGLPLASTLNGTPRLDDVLAYGSGYVSNTMDLGDRVGFLLEIQQQEVLGSGIPLRFSDLVAQVSEEVLQQLEEQMQADITRDNEVLKTWLKTHATPSVT